MNDNFASTQRRFLIGATAIAAALGAGCASQETLKASPANAPASPAAAVTAMTPKTPLTAAEQASALAAAANGMYEVAVAQLAVSRAENPEVKAYAQMLVDQHTASNRELMSMLTARGIPAPTGIPAARQERMRELSALTGTAFDGRFLRLVGIADHIADVGVFDQLSRTGTDPQLRDFATKMVPVLREHTRAAQMLVLSGR